MPRPGTSEALSPTIVTFSFDRSRTDLTLRVARQGLDADGFRLLEEKMDRFAACFVAADETAFTIGFE